MKKLYVKAEMKITCFGGEDIIVMSDSNELPKIPLDSLFTE